LGNSSGSLQVKQNFQRFDCGADTLRWESDARSG